MPHEVFIHRCLELAEQGRGKVGNGALVGAVLVRDGSIIAEGYHEAFGMLHAERQLLQKFDQKISSDDILYVNLEPCCHHGKTPPCTDIIIERGIKHVVYGMEDPDPRVRGTGIARLREAGIHVVGPVETVLCERFNRGFVSVRTNGRPYITMKHAHARDWRIAHSDGSPLEITRAEQNIWSHTYLRATHDAMLVGVGTIIADNPRLDARLDALSRDYHPLRIVLDPHLRIPDNARVVSDDRRSQTIIIHTLLVDIDAKKRARELVERGVQLIEVPLTDNTFDWQPLWEALLRPETPFHGLTSILVEGGAATWRIFRDAGMMDEELALIGE